MKKGISDANFIPDLGTDKFLEAASKAGYEGVELNLREKDGDITTEMSGAKARKLVHLAEHYRIEIASLTTGLLNDFPLSSNDPSVRQKGMYIGEKLIDFASEMGVEIVQMTPGVAYAGTPYQISYERAKEAFWELGDKAAAAGITIGIENVCKKFLASPLEFNNFLNDINHQSVQVYFDNGNALATGYPEHYINMLGDRFVAMHVKDLRLSVGDFVPIMEGDTNWPAMMNALNDIPYKGYLIATPPYPYPNCHYRHMEKFSQDLTTILNLIKINEKEETDTV